MSEEVTSFPSQTKQENMVKHAHIGPSQSDLRKLAIMYQNNYYYRKNAPGEEQRKGRWTLEERALFMHRLDEVGAGGPWGIFSMAIPGRVGYQCSNFYRGLILEGAVVDPNYYSGANGKLRCSNGADWINHINA